MQKQLKQNKSFTKCVEFLLNYNQEEILNIL